MKSIQTESHTIHFNTAAYNKLNTYLSEANISGIFIIADTNTHQHCVPHFLSKVATDLPIEIIEIEAGEAHKNIDTCVQVWAALSELGADRKSLVINVGGGVVTDLGGFVACTFKRGIAYINVPTSLLAMVDASVGGKTGVDLGALKNQIGVIDTGEMVLIDTSFLKTLPQSELRSGLAEMLKHGLVFNLEYWQTLSDLSQLDWSDLDGLIHESVVIKHNIVEQDPYERGLRKTLNFGHTLGHAIESYFLSQPEKTPLLHGEAVAIGMVLECYISNKLLNFPKTDLDAIATAIDKIYGKVEILPADHTPIIDLLKYDKKNEHGNINFVLLKAIGSPEIDCKVPNDLIIEAFNYYK